MDVQRHLISRATSAFNLRVLWSPRIFSVTWRHLTQSVLSSATLNDGVSLSSGSVKKCRTHKCGQLRTEDIGKFVCLYGWVHRLRMSNFLILRDSFGIVQVRLDNVINRSISGSSHEILSRESVVNVTGTVTARPPKDVNKELPTGHIEILADDLDLINPAQSPLPFFPGDFSQSNEQLRLSYRYLDLRSDFLQRNIKFRSDLILKMREYLCKIQGFVDVETPYLFRRTPGGAREFITPTSSPGLFYSLPQSPQQFKQLLMVGAVDRYMQVARCFRDEASRSDRQPEFTQLDLEMAFANSDDVMDVIEGVLNAVWPLISDVRLDSTPLNTPLPRMTYRSAMARYGSDKPDIRFDFRFCEATQSGLVGFKIPGSVASVLTKGELSRLLHDVFTEASQRVSFFEVGSCPPSLYELIDSLNADTRDIVVFVRGSEEKMLTALGNARVSVARMLHKKGVPIYSPGLHFMWIYDFPLFERNECGSWACVHHPFTAPTPETSNFIYTDPSKVIGQHYDLVCNGSEIGGGSIRIHDASLQEYILSTVLREDTKQMEYFITALKSGAPPHGGIALGLDRLIALILDTNSIRDVIAFPKGSNGQDLMCGAPSKVSEDDLKHYRITLNN